MKRWKRTVNHYTKKNAEGAVIGWIIRIDGRDIPVSKEVYQAYAQGNRKERYMFDKCTIFPPSIIENIIHSIPAADLYRIYLVGIKVHGSFLNMRLGEVSLIVLVRNQIGDWNQFKMYLWNKEVILSLTHEGHLLNIELALLPCRQALPKP